MPTFANARLEGASSGEAKAELTMQSSALLKPAQTLSVKRFRVIASIEVLPLPKDADT